MADFPSMATYRLRLTIPTVSGNTFLRHSISQTNISSTGIFTCYPSPTLLSLRLGPDLPREDEPSPGSLRLSASRILTYFYSLLMPASSLLIPPTYLTVHLRRLTVRSSTIFRSIASVDFLAPLHLRRKLS